MTSNQKTALVIGAGVVIAYFLLRKPATKKVATAVAPAPVSPVAATIPAPVNTSQPFSLKIKSPQLDDCIDCGTYAGSPIMMASVNGGGRPAFGEQEPTGFPQFGTPVILR
jgi:hypothetical protein